MPFFALFGMYSFVIKIAIDLVRAELLDFGTPILRLTKDNVEDTIVDEDPIKISERNENIFFVLKELFFFSNNHYQF